MPLKRLALLLALGLYPALARDASAQEAPAAAKAPRPWGRVSFFTNSSTMTVDGGSTTNLPN